MIVHEGDRLLAKPDLEVLYQPARGSVEDVVIARLVGYLNDSTFGDGMPPERRHDWTDFGPWK